MGGSRLVNVEVSAENMDRLIASKVELAMIEALSEDKEAFVEKIVKAAMTKRCDLEGKGHDHRYSRDEKPTHFECQVNEMIRKSAEGAFDEWLTENHTLLHDAITSRLRKAPKKFVNELAAALVNGLSGNLVVEAKLRTEDRY